MKRCGKCKEYKDESEFRKDRGKKDGLQFYCKPCHSAAVRSAPSQTPSEQRLRYALLSDEQYERVRALNRAAGARYRAKRLAEDPESFRAENAAKAAKWRKDNPEDTAETMRRYRAAHSRERLDQSVQYRARKMGATVEPIDYEEIIRRDNDMCHICGEPVDPDATTYEPLARTFDHIIPLILGGSHSMDNLKVAHRRCNVRKDAQTRRTNA